MPRAEGVNVGRASPYSWHCIACIFFQFEALDLRFNDSLAEEKNNETMKSNLLPQLCHHHYGKKIMVCGDFFLNTHENELWPIYLLTPLKM